MTRREAGASAGTAIRAVCIDLDGTLLDTIPDLAAAANAMLEDLGHAPLPQAQIREFVGKGADVLIARALHAAGGAGSSVLPREGSAEVVTDWDAGLDVGGAAGKALVTTGIPNTTALAEAIDRESVLVFTTATSEPLDLIRVGIAVERAWLAAVDARLSASVLTHPLRVEDSAARFAERLALPGRPQLIMRIGY